MTTPTVMPATDADARAERRSKLAAGLLALSAFVFCLTFWSLEADGNVSVVDTVNYALGAERNPAQSIVPHHPLYHLLVIALTQVTRACGLPQPGSVAVRLVAGSGAALLMWLLVRMAGRARVAVGVACAVLVATSRIVAVEGAVGETLLPACAAALWVFDRASRPAPDLRLIGTGLWIALLLRQDNIVLLPAILLLLARACSWRQLIALVSVVGFAALGFYALVWKVIEPDRPLLSWLISTAEATTNQNFLTVDRIAAYSVGLGDAIFSSQWSIDASTGDGVMALAWVAVVSLAAWLCRGRSADGRVVACWMVALACRWVFYAWFEPMNIEWHVLTIIAFAAIVARSAQTAGATAPRASSRAGISLLVLPICAAALLAWPSLVRLREHRLVSAIAAAWEQAGSTGMVIATEYQVGAACTVLGIPAEYVGSTDMAAEFGKFVDRSRASPEPLLMITDRMLQGGGRFSMNGGAIATNAQLDTLRFEPAIRTVSAEGHVFALIANAASRPAPASRP